jgi:chemotaxis protein methyltransferase CheR
MIDALATNHTSFLREPDHFQLLTRRVIPELAARDALDVWCAACSTGEEVWTLACLLNEALPSRRIRITATDISNKALRFASEGSYARERCQGLPGNWLLRYFIPEGSPVQAYRVQPQIKAQVHFQRVNLLERISWARPFPVIFCRNVMIYFDRDTQSQVVRQLSNWLEPGGYLFVGHAESLTRVEHDLEYVQPAVYRKPPKGPSRWTRSS